MSAKKELRQYTLDARKVRRVQRFLGVKTETEALEQILDNLLANRRAYRAHKRLVESGGEIVDVMGRMTK